MVVGVLLALWAAEWAQDRAEADRHAKAMDSLHREIRITQAIAARAVMADACILAQSQALKEMLEQDDPMWPGLKVRGSFEDGQLMAAPLIYPVNGYSVETYMRARETGALEEYSEEKELAYEEIFYIFRTLDQYQAEFDTAISKLRPLSSPRPIDPATRLEMLQHLAAFDDYRRGHLGQFRSLVHHARIVGMQISVNDLEEIEEWLGKDRLVRAFGDCVQEIDWATGLPVAN